jgi:hypothetical protein
MRGTPQQPRSLIILQLGHIGRAAYVGGGGQLLETSVTKRDFPTRFGAKCDFRKPNVFRLCDAPSRRSPHSVPIWSTHLEVGFGRGVMENGSERRIIEDDIRQRFFLAVGEDSGEKPGVVNGCAQNGSKQPRATRRTTENEAHAVLFVQVKDGLSSLGIRISQVEGLLYELLTRLDARNIEKEFYTTVEVAKILGKRPYTVREWCRLGRVNAEKSLSGRGIDDEWRISHQELLRIQNEGLLPLGKPGRVRPR